MTENKRYFKKMWEEEYYIFDSETISEEEFDEKVEYEDYQAFADSMSGDDVVNRLNGLDGTVKSLTDDYEQLLKENKELQGKYDRQLWIYNGLGCEYDQLKEENEELKQVLGSMLIEVKQEISASHKTGEIRAFINPKNYNLISDVLRRYGALKGWYDD